MFEAQARRPFDANDYGHHAPTAMHPAQMQGSMPQQLPPQQFQAYNPYQQQQAQHYPQQPAAHSRRASASSGYPMSESRRTPSVTTFNTTASGDRSQADIRRSISSRSGGSQQGASSYVALLRRQKATVWCDRSQSEDPNAAALRRQAKIRATLEVSGAHRRQGLSSQNSRSGTGISSMTTTKVAAKIRHHGKQALIGFAPAESHVGVSGLPVRLSATEAEGESSEEEDSVRRSYHRRAGSSGRSSIASARRSLPYRPSISSTPKRSSPTVTPERRTSVVDDHGPASSIRSASSIERVDSIAELGPGTSNLASNSIQHAVARQDNASALRRSGSVDDRTTSLSQGRLFIANPD